MKIAFLYTGDLKAIKKFILSGNDAVIYEIKGTIATYCLVYVNPDNSLEEEIVSRIGWIKYAPLGKIPCFCASNSEAEVYLTLKNLSKT